MENVDKSLVHQWIKKGHSYQWISETLIHMYPNRKGFSPRSVRRFCDKHNIKKLSSNELDALVDEAVKEVHTHDVIYIKVYRYE